MTLEQYIQILDQIEKGENPMLPYNIILKMRHFQGIEGLLSDLLKEVQSTPAGK